MTGSAGFRLELGADDQIAEVAEPARDALAARLFARALLISGIVAGAALLGVASLSLSAGADFDYARVDEARQQRILDEMAEGLKFGLARAAGGALAVRGVEADASADALALSAQFVDPRFEDVAAEDIALFSKKVYADSCNHFLTRKVIAGGVSVRYILARPSGRPFADFTFDRETCAPHTHAAVG